MFKRIISLGLCLVMLAVLFTGCGNKNAETTTATNTDDLPATINLVGITEASTTPDAIERVEEALNKLSKTRYKTKVNLTLVTADEYIAEVEKRIAQADHAAIKIKAITKYNALAQKEANNAQKLMNESSGKKNNKWTSQVTTVIASTMATGEVYTAEMTTVYEDGKIETVYPDAQSPIDILMIDDKEMYDYLNEKGYLLSVEKKLDEKFTKFRQYIYPTYFSQLKAMTGDVNAIPNNNLLAEYTYLVIDREIAEAYNNGNGYNIDDFEDYDDIADFLAYVKANYKDVAPMAKKPEALGIFKYMEGDVAIGTYFDPIYGYDTAEGTDFVVQNLLAIPQYQAYVELMKDYETKGYFGGADKAAVQVIKGDASIPSQYEDKYEVKVIQNPFVEPTKIFDGMMAVSSYTSSEDRALEILEMLNTDPDAKNIFQYGILDDGDNTEYANYKLVELEDGQFTVERLNNNYMMDNGLTGNVYMGYPEPGQAFDAWSYYKQTNLDSAVSPFMLLYVEEKALDNILTSVLKRAALTEALAKLDITYEEYIKETTGTPSSKGQDYIRALRAEYMVYLMSELAKTENAFENLDIVAPKDASNVVKEFVKFAQSKEGQQILIKAGYVGDVEKAPAYEKVASLTGEITMISNIGSTRTYIEGAFNGLSDAFLAMYPNVKINRPVPNPDGLAGYDKNMSEIKNANMLGFTTKKAEAYDATTVAKDYTAIFNNPNSTAVAQTWYENRIIEQVQAEYYSDIISANDLEKLVQNKVAFLGGAKNQRDKENKVIVDTERLTLAAAKESANNYFTNIKYLRVMADEILFKDLSEAERAKYDSMTDVDFENAVFAYVKANYETENNLTDEDYQKRVQDFMVSVLEYTSEEDGTTKYLVSWDDFVTAENGYTDYMNAAQAIVDQYRDILLSKGYVTDPALMNIMSLDALMDLVYDAMYDEYLEANGLSKDEFKEMIQNKYLKAVGTEASEFATYSKTSDEYKNYVNKLRKKYKAILIDNFSANAYKNGEKGISNEKVVDTLYAHFLEEELGIYTKMADMSGLTVADFRTSEKHYENYSKYISTLKTKYVYTLRTKYTQAQINSWSLADAKTNILNLLAETGFYTNELAKYIGQELSEYMLAKSDAVTYQNHLKSIADALATEIAAKGYDKDALLEGDGTELEALAREIVEEKYFAEKQGITEVLKSTTGQYVKDYTDVNEMKANAELLSKDAFFMAVVNELQSMWDEIKAAETK